MPVQVEEGFGEHDPGEGCDGMAMEEFLERYGTAGWTEDPFGVTFPGGETLAAFQYRVGATVRRWCDAHPEATIVVSCHGGVVDAVVRQALRALPTGGFQLHTLNTSITELFQPAPNSWVLCRYGDAAHLAGLPEATPQSPATSRASG